MAGFVLWIATILVLHSNYTVIKSSKPSNAEEIAVSSSDQSYTRLIGRVYGVNNAEVEPMHLKQIHAVLTEANVPERLSDHAKIIIFTGSIKAGSYRVLSSDGTLGFSIRVKDAEGHRGLYLKSGQQPIILLSSLIFGTSELKEILLHELGHLLGDLLTSTEWTEYYEIRSIPHEVPRYANEWKRSPNEDFAEVYKYFALKFDETSGYYLATSFPFKNKEEIKKFMAQIIGKFEEPIQADR